MPKRNTKKQPDTTENLTIRFPSPLLRKLSELAAKEERSRNQFILRTLREKVEAGE